MVNIDQIEATYSRKVQLERYEPIEVAETITGTPEEGEDVDEAYDELYEQARSDVERKITHRLAAKRMEDSRVEDNE